MATTSTAGHALTEPDLATATGAAPSAALPGELKYVQYEHALEAVYLPAIRALISKDLSEPYSIYVYRYFLYQWGHLCFMVRIGFDFYEPRPPLFTPCATLGFASRRLLAHWSYYL